MANKRLCILLTAAFLLGGCTETEQIPVLTEEVSAESETAEPTTHAQILAALLRENFPVTDGSTSAIPLDAALRAGVFGISPDDAEAEVVHSTSHQSFTNLLEGKCELVFCHLLSDAQNQQAEQMGIAVELTPIAREGFVFLVSADNPVDSLTVEQVKGIYSGAITNWSQVGGEDRPITAFQRNITSGSQNYMTAFMGDTPLMDAPTELRPGGMDSLVDAVAAYDGEGGSIGYSVYSYVGGMYDAGGGVKILAIDGVSPTPETIADGSYPCTGYNYAVIRAEEKTGSPARNFLEWILTEDGQRAIAGTGYFAPLDPHSGITVTIRNAERYSQTGTGRENFIASDRYVFADPVPGRAYTSPIGAEAQINGRRFTCYGWQPMTGNDALDAEITEFLDRTVEKMAAMTPDIDINTWEEIPTVQIQWEANIINGYLSLKVTRSPYHYPEVYAYVQGAVWDIQSGRRMNLSDLFSAGSDFIGRLNTAVQERIDYANEWGIWSLEMIRPFEGIEAGFANFSLGSSYPFSLGDRETSVIHLNLHFNPGENSYFGGDYCLDVPVSVRTLENCLLNEARGTGCTAFWPVECYSLRQEEFVLPEEETRYTGQYRWAVLEDFPSADKINADFDQYLKEHYVPETISLTEDVRRAMLEQMRDPLRWYYGITEPTVDDLLHWESEGWCHVQVESTLICFGERYAAFSTLVRTRYGEQIGYKTGVISHRSLVVYDLTNGERVESSVLFSDPERAVGLTGITEWQEGQYLLTYSDGILGETSEKIRTEMLFLP